MASQSAGIQQLLAAEKKAAEKVAEARKRKARRLRQAKEEAQVEIENFRAEYEAKYKDYENKVLGSRGDMEQSIQDSTQKKIADLNLQVKKKREHALNKLLDIVYDIKPELHENYKIM